MIRITKFIFWSVVILVFVFTVLTVRQLMVISMMVRQGSYDQQPYNREVVKPRLKILFLGDSTAVGTGSGDNRSTTAGYFGQDFSNASITNISHNGQKIHELLASLDRLGLGDYDLAVIQIGANDILRFTSFTNIENDLILLLEHIKKHARHVAVLHSGNVGTAPIFRWPFDLIMTERSRRVREIYQRQARAQGFYYVDLFQERKDDIFLTDIARYYSPDLLHPSADGYRWWYERIRQTLDKAGINLN